MTYAERITFITLILGFLKIPYTVNELWDGWQIRFPWCEGDVAAHRGTYGAANGKVESYQFPWDDDDVTVLTPREAAIKIIAYFNEIVLGE